MTEESNDSQNVFIRSFKEDLSEKSIADMITAVLLTVGITPNVKGFFLLREAICIVVEDENRVRHLCASLYPAVAEKYHDKSTCVERGIRHAIDMAYNKGKISRINDIFGIHIYDEYEKPTNSEFIAIVADRVRQMVNSRN